MNAPSAPVNIFLLSIVQTAYSVQLAKGLSRKDRVMVGLHEKDGRALVTNFSDFFRQAGFTYRLIPHYRFPDPRLAWIGWSTYRRIRRHRSELIHIQSGRDFLEHLITVRLAVYRNIPVVSTLHDIALHPGDWFPARRRWILSWILWMTDRFIVHGHSLADRLSNDYGIDRRVIHVVPHGNYDLYHYATGAGETRKPISGRVLFFGRMFAYKGLAILVEAAKLISVQIPSLKIVIAGQGPELDRLLPVIKNIPCFEILNRFIEPKEIKSLFTRASLVVLPYIEASQSGVLAMAYSFGRPVIASRVGAIPEMLTDGEEGLLVPPKNPNALAGAMLRLLKDDLLAKRMGAAGRKKAETRLDWNKDVAQLTRQVYRQAIEMKKKDAAYRKPSRRTLLRHINTHMS